MFGNLFGKKKNQLSEIDESYVFDKAKYHFDSIEEASLEQEQAYVHTGLFFAWIIKNELYSNFLKSESEEEINQTKKEEISPCELYMNWDGVFIGELLNKVGYHFTKDYFDFESGSYMTDYENLFCDEDTSIFGIANSWDNYHLIARVITQRFNEWKADKTI